METQAGRPVSMRLIYAADSSRNVARTVARNVAVSVVRNVGSRQCGKFSAT